ncbi:hypothetical protein ACB092_01G317700 [Castanea dentata]
MELQGASDINLKGPRSKKKKLDEYNNWRPWPDLPEPMLDLITKSLGPIDYLMFGCVCRTWRSYVATYKKGFLASQPPLVLFLSTHARRACYFYSIFDRKLYKAIPPNLIGKSCLGVTCGYLVLKDKEERTDSQIWLLNPFTRHELRFPSPPKTYCHFILATLATPLPEFVLIAFCRWQPYFQFCRSTDVHWTVYDYNDKFNSSPRHNPWMIVDGAVFKGKVYVLTSHAELGILNLNSHPYVTLLKVKGIADLNCRLQFRLLASDEQLLMIRGIIEFDYHTVFELNFLKMKWVQRQSIGDQALFLGHRTGSGLYNITRWKGHPQCANCIYKVGSATNKYGVQFLDGRYPKSFPIMQGKCMPDFNLGNYQFWYFPHLSCSVDSLVDD